MSNVEPFVSDEPDSASSTLLGQLRARDPQAWERLCDLYGPLVYHWCRRAGLQPQDSADLFQEVFQSAAKAIGTFRRQEPGDSFRGWLAVITRNKIRDHFRSAANRPNAAGGTDFYEQLQNVPDFSDGDTSSESDGEFRGVIRRALDYIRAEFREPTWQAFWQTAVDQRAPADVAADLGVSVNAVYKAKCRVLRRLREELDGLV